MKKVNIPCVGELISFIQKLTKHVDFTNHYSKYNGNLTYMSIVVLKRKEQANGMKVVSQRTSTAHKQVWG